MDSQHVQHSMLVNQLKLPEMDCSGKIGSMRGGKGEKAWVSQMWLLMVPLYPCSLRYSPNKVFISGVKTQSANHTTDLSNYSLKYIHLSFFSFVHGNLMTIVLLGFVENILG